jgi:hypothetical protein
MAAPAFRIRDGGPSKPFAMDMPPPKVVYTCLGEDVLVR